MIQTTAHGRGEFDRRWPGILVAMERAAAAGAQLIVAPEGTVPAYVLGPEPIQPGLIDGAERDVAAIARRFGCTIVYGTAHLDEGRAYNAAYVVGPQGTRLGAACKRFLWHFDRQWFAPGDETEPIQTPFGPIGVLICADGRIPTIAGELVRRGARMLVMPTAWVTSGRDPGALENLQADLMVRVRAKENGVPLLAANKCGVELGSVAYCGKSTAVDASGTILAQAGSFDETILFVNVEPAAGAPAQAPLPAPEHQARAPVRARIALASARAGAHGLEHARLAARSGAEVIAGLDGGAMLASIPREIPEGVYETAGIRFAAIGDRLLRDPFALIEARLAGADLIVVRSDDTSEWLELFTRTRAAELRAYAIALGPERSFACDPDGAVICGTFGEYEIAAFPYDGARTLSGFVAPQTDVFEGLAAQTRRSRRKETV